jgi:hypothetical protein
MMRTTIKSRPSNPKQSQNANGRGIRGKSSRDGKPEQTLCTVLDDPDLWTGFPNYLEITDPISGNQALKSTFVRLISDGCALRVLLWLLAGYVWEEQVLALWKKDLDSLKSEFDGLIRRLEALSAKIVSVNSARILENSLWDSLAFDLIDERVGTKFARDYMFSQLPGSLVWAKAFLQELKQNLAREHSVRQQPPAGRLAWLYLYCCAGTGRRVTYREIADLLSAGFVAKGSERVISEATVRMGLQRFKNSAAALSYEHLELLMKDYVRACPTGDPNLSDWFKSNGADWVSAHVRPLCPGRAISEKERQR